LLIWTNNSTYFGKTCHCSEAQHQKKLKLLGWSSDYLESLLDNAGANFFVAQL
jgi:hypothetical protein